MAAARRLALFAIQGVAGLLGLMYLASAYSFITTHSIDFIHYTASSTQEVWTVRNLGIRLLAIGAGLLGAVILRRRDLLALMLSVRLIADCGDFLNSLVTPGLDAFVARTLAVFVMIEMASLGGLLWIHRSEERTTPIATQRTVT